MANLTTHSDTDLDIAGPDTVGDVAKTFGLLGAGLAALLGFAALILFHPEWVVPVALLLTGLLMAILVRITRM